MKFGLVITCASFTGVMLLFAVFSDFGMAPEVNNDIVYQAFLMSVSIAVLMAIAEKIEMKFEVVGVLTDAVIRIAICYLVVFFEGTLFGMISFSWESVRDITPVLLPVFILTYAVGYIVCAEWADSINESIRKKDRK